MAHPTRNWRSKVLRNMGIVADINQRFTRQVKQKTYCIVVYLTLSGGPAFAHSL
jgi:hypothetical protein